MLSCKGREPPDPVFRQAPSPSEPRVLDTRAKAAYTLFTDIEIRYMLRELFLGFSRVHILYHAGEGRVYGAALMAELARHGYTLSPGTLYPILHRLEGDGYLQRKEAVVNGRVRKYYTLTPAGRRTLARAKTQLRELVAEVLSPVACRTGQRQRTTRGGPAGRAARRSHQKGGHARA